MNLFFWRHRSEIVTHRFRAQLHQLMRDLRFQLVDAADALQREKLQAELSVVESTYLVELQKHKTG